ncbi:uncharacterized protein CANTADRAFT_21852 [Suhomyces tanzawaensis NRRL Y-17324]|uniref:Uncharacterized protein n=1 Tax=Suhomyces tanzawaensis NRRL Y-17324 TaxID=984487 RepID=A0A1E4SHW2_9ASCO|nr:uncharacterized protein CANTADRAFT_21852 [Suhomyces tanzawaensis NRRL Y-17324]ODV79083.1 hypothetical protein CANTADRAFT_21852 [Suhomyces tanzawaensis NRRL Y-17324]
METTIVGLLLELVDDFEVYSDERFETIRQALLVYQLLCGGVLSKRLETVVESLMVLLKSDLQCSSPRSSKLVVFLFTCQIVHFQKYWSILINLCPLNLDDSLISQLVSRALSEYSTSWISCCILSNIAQNLEIYAKSIKIQLSSRAVERNESIISSKKSLIKSYVFIHLMRQIGFKQETEKLSSCNNPFYLAADPELIISDIQNYNHTYLISEVEGIPSSKLQFHLVQLIDQQSMVIWSTPKDKTDLVPSIVNLSTFVSLTQNKSSNSVTIEFDTHFHKENNHWNSFAFTNLADSSKHHRLKLWLELSQPRFSQFVEIFALLIGKPETKISQTKYWIEIPPTIDSQRINFLTSNERGIELVTKCGLLPHSQLNLPNRHMFDGQKSEPSCYKRIKLDQTSDTEPRIHSTKNCSKENLSNLFSSEIEGSSFIEPIGSNKEISTLIALVQDSQPSFTPLNANRYRHKKPPKITSTQSKIASSLPEGIDIPFLDETSEAEQNSDSNDTYDVFMEKISCTRPQEITADTTYSSEKMGLTSLRKDLN